MKQYAVIGLGNFGYNLAIELGKKGHDVLVIDSDRDRIQAISEKVTHAVVHDIRSGEYAKEYITEEFDTVVLNLGDSIEPNILAIYHLKEVGVKNIIVKSVSEVHSDIYLKIGATEIINPEKIAGERLADQLSSPNLVDSIPLSPDYGMYEVAMPDKFVGKTIKEIGFRKKYKIEIIAIKDVMKDETEFIPDPDSKIEPDSALLFVCKKEHYNKLGF